MICPNCAHEMSGERGECDYCGFRLRTPSKPVNEPIEPEPSLHSYDAPIPSSVADRDESPLSIGKYIGMFIVSAIPVVGLIVLFIWTCSGSSNLNVRNFSAALLIIRAFLLVFTLGAVLVLVLLYTPALYYLSNLPYYLAHIFS